MAVTSRLLGASGVVIAGVVVAVALGQFPAVGATDHAITATPESAAQHLVCPGSPVAVGAAGTKASTLSADGATNRRVDVAGTGSATARRLGGGNVQGGPDTAPRLYTAPAASGKHGAIAGVQTQVVTTGDVSGLTATDCSVPVNTAWIAAGATTTGRTSVLTLADASSVPADVTVRIWTEGGEVAGNGIGDILVPAHSRRAVSLASLVPNAAGTVLQVTSTGGQVGVALEQRTVRGLESGGLDLTGPTTAPATEQVLTGVRISGATAVAQASSGNGYADLLPVVRLLAPGSAPANVRLLISGSPGAAGKTITRRIDGGKVTDITLPGLNDGVYSVRVLSTRPVVAGARVSVVADAGASTTDTGAAATGTTTNGTGTDGTVAGGTSTGTDAGLVGGPGAGPAGTDAAGGMNTAGTATTATARGIDLAWIAAAEPLGTDATVAVGDGPSPMLTLANAASAAVKVQLSGTTGASLTVPAGGTASVAVQPGMGTLRGASGLRAAVSFAGSAAVAAYPVLPADQAAHPVRVTH